MRNHYKTYSKNDPNNYLAPIEKFKVKIKGIKLVFNSHSFYVNYIRPYENAHLKILNKPGPKSIKSEVKKKLFPKAKHSFKN